MVIDRKGVRRTNYHTCKIICIHAITDKNRIIFSSACIYFYLESVSRVFDKVDAQVVVERCWDGWSEGGDPQDLDSLAGHVRLTDESVPHQRLGHYMAVADVDLGVDLCVDGFMAKRRQQLSTYNMIIQLG